jgi:hypothetical protein
MDFELPSCLFSCEEGGGDGGGGKNLVEMIELGFKFEAASPGGQVLPGSDDLSAIRVEDGASLTTSVVNKPLEKTTTAASTAASAASTTTTAIATASTAAACQDGEEEEHPLWYSPVLNRFRKDRPPEVQGGWLADEMGLGKVNALVGSFKGNCFRPHFLCERMLVIALSSTSSSSFPSRIFPEV